MSGGRGTKVLVGNCGSSTIKIEVFTIPDCVSIAHGLLERIGSMDSRYRQRRRQADGNFVEEIHQKPIPDHRAGFEFIQQVNAADRIIKANSELFGIGHRIVHGGEKFREPTLIDKDVMNTIRKLIPLAPLHNPSNLHGIEAALERFPDVPQVAVFDTAFHQTLPPHAFHYGLPFEFYTKHGVRRYGFHGISHIYVGTEAAHFLGKPWEETNLITLHLGNGVSATAIRNGQSIDTSMGFTPLEGLLMGTRCGDMDPALHFYLLRQAGKPPEELEEIINAQSGLKGICGVSDMREIQHQASQGNKQARLAIDMFCYRLKKYIGAYAAVLDRVDAIVFTGGIGENSSVVRERTCTDLENLGIILDREKNEKSDSSARAIHRQESPVAILVIPTDEELEIARETIATIEKTLKNIKCQRGKPGFT